MVFNSGDHPGDMLFSADKEGFVIIRNGGVRDQGVCVLLQDLAGLR